MKNYFKRLKGHPGLGIAAIYSVMCFFAAGTNKNIHSVEGVLILGGIGSLFFWGIVLITNFKK